MKPHFFPGELVRISIPSSLGRDSDEEMIFGGEILEAESGELVVALSDCKQSSLVHFQSPVPCVVRKSMTVGMLETDGTAQLLRVADTPIITVTLAGAPRAIQRRSFCRIELRADVRYCNLDAACDDAPRWETAELHEVSLGGAGLVLKRDALAVGQQLLTEFELNSKAFSLPAVVRRRLDRSKENGSFFYGIEFLDFETSQLNRMAKTVAQLQLKLINSRVKVE